MSNVKTVIFAIILAFLLTTQSYSVESQKEDIPLNKAVGLDQEAGKGGSSFAPGQIIVKFHNNAVVGAVADLLFTNGQSFASIEKNSNLDYLNNKHKTKRIKKLVKRYAKRRTSKIKTLSRDQAHQLQMESIKDHQSRFLSKMNISSKLDINDLDAIGYLGNAYVISFEDPHIDILEVCKEYKNDPHIKDARPNCLFDVDAQPTDPSYGEQWSHQLTNAEAGWDIETGDTNVIIAVLDTGVDYNHEDLAANIWRDNHGNPGFDNVDIDVAAYLAQNYELVQGEDYTGVDQDPMDFFGHGTHCAGIAAAVANNGKGVVGVAHGCRIMPVRVGFQIKANPGGMKGKISESAVIDGIYDATDNGAQVITMSLSLGSAFNSTFQIAVNHANVNNVVVLASSGNDGAKPINHYPSMYEHVIAVCATGYEGYKAKYANYGLHVDVTAPGGNGAPGQLHKYMLSTVPFTGGVMANASGYGGANGTSMSAPYAAGIVALLKSGFPDDSAYGISGRLMASCNSIPGTMGKMSYLGAGLVNVEKALSMNERAFCMLRRVDYTDVNGSAKSDFTPNDSARLVLGVENVWEDASYVVAELDSDSPYISIPSKFYSFGPLTANGRADNAHNPFVIDIGDVPIPAQGVNIELDITLYFDGVIRTKKTYIAVNQPVDVFDPPEGDYFWYDLSGHKYVYQENHTANQHAYILAHSYDINTGETMLLSRDPNLVDLIYTFQAGISGNNVIWESNVTSGGIFSTDDIHIFNLLTETEDFVCNDPGAQVYPEISGSKVLWADFNQLPSGAANLDLFGYDLFLNQQFPIRVDQNSVASFPSAYGDLVVWTDNRNDSGDIYMLDLSTMQESVICNAPGQQTVPNISNNKIVWLDYRNASGDVYMYDLDTNQESVICDDPSEQVYPRIFNDRIVWVDGRYGNGDIFMYDLTTQEEVQITAGSSYESKGEVSGTKIAWVMDKKIWHVNLVNRSLGDTDQDGGVTSDDALRIDDYLADAIWLEPVQWENADVTDDGLISMHDAAFIREYAAGGIAQVENPITIGDVNGDGVINILDAMMTAQYDQGITTLTLHQRLAGDVNGDGDTDMIDANLIGEYVVGLIKQFPFVKK